MMEEEDDNGGGALSDDDRYNPQDNKDDESFEHIGHLEEGHDLEADNTKKKKGYKFGDGYRAIKKGINKKYIKDRMKKSNVEISKI